MTVITGEGGPEAEGAHIGLGVQRLGQATLDAFLRFILMHLVFFREMVDHPGFAWGASLPHNQMEIRYVTSVTHEKDPEKRKEILQRYKDEVAKEFRENPVPID